MFDWDNTLVNSWPVIHAALEHTFIQMGKTPWSYEETLHNVHRSLKDAFPNLFGDKWEEAREHYYQHFLAHHLEHIKPLEGAEETLKLIQDHGIYLSVVSNKTGKYLREEMSYLGWDDYFVKKIGATDAPQDKPDPIVVELALSGSGIEAGAEVWFIGDTVSDIDCALNSGCVPLLYGEQGLPEAYLEEKGLEDIMHLENHAQMQHMIRGITK